MDLGLCQQKLRPWVQCCPPAYSPCQAHHKTTGCRLVAFSIVATACRFAKFTRSFCSLSKGNPHNIRKLQDYTIYMLFLFFLLLLWLLLIGDLCILLYYSMLWFYFFICCHPWLSIILFFCDGSLLTDCCWCRCLSVSWVFYIVVHCLLLDGKCVVWCIHFIHIFIIEIILTPFW